MLSLFLSAPLDIFALEKQLWRSSLLSYISDNRNAWLLGTIFTWLLSFGNHDSDEFRLFRISKELLVS